MVSSDIPTPDSDSASEPADSRNQSWREHFHAARERASEARQRWAFLVLTLVVAVAAGFAGGRIGNHSSIVNGSLSDQKKIVTSQGELINQIAKDVGPSVVSVNVTTQTTSSDFFGMDQTSQQQAAGTGIVISSNGIIMTNRHVVPAGTTDVSVTLSDGTEFDNVKVLGRTSSSDSIDVAFLKIQDLKGHKLTPATIGDSSTAKVGDAVVAIGNALGQFQNTVTSGIISGFGRQVQASSDDGSNGSSGSSNSEDLDNLIQTDAAINEGNSGGPLVNLNGQVVGINTAIASGAENIGFAIPINDIKGLISQVLKSGSFARPFLGVRYFSLTSAVAKEFALSVTHGAYLAPPGISGSSPLVSGSPAEKAGLKPGDIILAVDGKSVDAQHSLTTLLNQHQPGDEVTLKVLRGGNTISVHVTLGETPSNS